MDTKDTFLSTIGQLFDTDCNFNGLATMYGSGNSHRTFTETERTKFLDHLWDKWQQQTGAIDFTCPQAVSAMMAVQRKHYSMQDQIAEFPTQFQLEVERAKQQQKGKK